MQFGSVCSGIEAASVAWNPLGWRAAWLSEIEPFPAAVLAHHYPDVPNLGDMTTLPARIASGEVDAPDVFCGGTPCQAFSVAGLRKSLDDARGNLSLTFCEIANEIDAARSIRGEQPAIVFWENVPGVLNTKDNAFGCFLAGLAGEDDPLDAPGGKWTNAGCVFGPKRAVAWRVLDAQYFGVAQRRRRVFVVASARNDFDPAKVLFEFDGVRRDIAPSRETRKVAAASPASGAGVGGQQQYYACGGIGSYHSSSASATLLKTGQDLGPGCEAIITMAHGQGGAEIATDRSPTLTCNHEAPIAAYGIPGNWIGRKPENGGNAVEPMHNVAPCLTSTDRHGVAVGADCYNGSLTGDVACTMGTPGSSVNASGPTVMVPIGFHPGNLARGSGPSPSGEVFGTLTSSHGRGSTDQFPHVAIPLAFPANLSGTQCASSENLSPALGAANPTAVAFALQHAQIGRKDNAGPQGKGWQEGLAFTQDSRSCADAVVTAYSFDSLASNSMKSSNPHSGCREISISKTIDTTTPCPSKNQGGIGIIHSVPMQVRRLTPTECERLQGFPEIKKTATITVFQHSNSNVCLSDQPSTNVLAALQSHKSLSNASPAEESVFPSNASAAALNLSASQASSSVPVLVSVQIDLERQHLRLHSQEKLLLSASIADANEWCLLPIQAGDFVQLSVAMLAALEKKTPRGKVELHLNTSGSFPLLIGNLFANQSGREIEELASDAGKFMSAVKKCTTSITSEAGRNSQNFESNLQTLLCSVTTAISSFIPREIRSASSYALSIEVSHGYTAIPWRKKPASDCPDGPRYKALGNSWAVPVVRWIGERISSELFMDQTAKPAANDPKINQNALF